MLIKIFSLLKQINLATSPAAAHLISRAQNGSSVPVCIAQQAVLLGNSSTPTLTASQAQMYLRAQMVNPLTRAQPQLQMCFLNKDLFLHNADYNEHRLNITRFI